MPAPGFLSFRASPRQKVLTAGSCAAQACEPRQVRKEAAVSKSLRVLQGSLVRAGCLGNAWEIESKAGARLFI